MYGKKKIFFARLIILTIFLSACSAPKPAMDQLNKNGQYHYVNEDLGFSLDLPADFIYYQTQRKTKPEYTDIEFFVPTSDRLYRQEVEGYAKPIIVRVYQKAYWEKNQNDKTQTGFTEIGQNRLNVYTIKYWDQVPSDWQKKWSKDQIDNITKSFKY